jgi:hypothetical protein
MYKHECVNCLVEHKYKCIFNIGFWSRFIGNDEVKFCPEYLHIIKYQKRIDRLMEKKQHE